MKPDRFACLDLHVVCVCQSSAGARNWHVSDDERAGAAAPPATGGVLQRNRQRAASEHLSDDSSSVNPATCRAASGPSRASSQSVLKSKSMCQLSWAQDTHRDSAGSRCPRHVIDPAQRRRHRHSNSFVCGRGGDLAAEVRGGAGRIVWVGSGRCRFVFGLNGC